MQCGQVWRGIGRQAGEPSNHFIQTKWNAWKGFSLSLQPCDCHRWQIFPSFTVRALSRCKKDFKKYKHIWFFSGWSFHFQIIDRWSGIGEIWLNPCLWNVRWLAVYKMLNLNLISKTNMYYIRKINNCHGKRNKNIHSPSPIFSIFR